MKLLKGWKTIIFNIAAILVLTWSDTRDGLVSIMGGWEYATVFLAIANLVLRTITVGPIALMWISKEEQDGIQTREEK